LQRCFHYFYPEATGLVEELQELAASLDGRLSQPKASWKYAWIENLFGFVATKHTQLYAKAFALRAWDQMMYSVDRRGALLPVGVVVADKDNL
jgi:hypothetical protein